MEKNKNLEMDGNFESEEKNSFDFQSIYTALVLNWKWFIFSLIVCIGLAFIYLRYTTPIYQASAKILIKDDESNGPRSRNSLLSSNNLGIMTNSSGIENEMEILTSHSIAQETVRDLKLYVNYFSKGKVHDILVYKNQPISVDIDPAHLEKINSNINLEIQRQGNKYHITGIYYVPTGENSALGPFSIDKFFSQLPATIGTRAGILSFNSNSLLATLSDGAIEKVIITSPRAAAYKYVGALTVSQTQKNTSIANLVLRDESPERATDYLKQLSIVYNRQANEDKNEVSLRTEEFINGRLEKINAELGNTEGQLESYKKRNNMVELDLNAGQNVQNADVFSQKLAEVNTQSAILNEMQSYMNDPNNKYEAIPSNVGLTDPASTSLINRYNEIAQERKRLLRSASESSPTVTPLTSQLDDLTASIKSAMSQARKTMNIQVNSVARQFGKYQGAVGSTPEQERMLTQIGRQQEVKSGLYLMLLQKREENSISLAATADKGKLIDDPAFEGKVSPRSAIIVGLASVLGLAIPTLLIFILQFFKYKIEGHDDVAKLTKLPILADVAVASETAKTKADIVVHENQNNQMEEIFRSIRTNLQFIMAQDQKVIMFTSSLSGEGKTFTAANLAVSFALLSKKVIIVGLDIRKPRLAELFEINDHHHGITPLLIKSEPTWEDVTNQIVSSGINNNLDMLLAGPIPPNPAELVARPSLDMIINLLKEHYDYVLIDTAPVGLVTDSLQIGRVADATVYLCRADYTPKEAFSMINNLADEKKLNNMCLVLNGIDMSKKKNSYYYGYGRYGQYGRYGRYGHYGNKGSYGNYGNYQSYGSYGNYAKSHYGDSNDTSVKQ